MKWHFLSGRELTAAGGRFTIMRGVDLRGKTEWTASDRSTGKTCSSNLLRLMRAWCEEQWACFPPATTPPNPSVSNENHRSTSAVTMGDSPHDREGKGGSEGGAGDKAEGE